MLVGVPTEIKTHEYRVGLVPGAVREYVAHGHEVLFQSGARDGIGANDETYRAAGATIATDAAEGRCQTNARKSPIGGTRSLSAEDQAIRLRHSARAAERSSL